MRPLEPPRLFLARHGRAAAPDGAMIGGLDVPLGPEGRLEALGLAGRLDPGAIGQVLTSPLARARETAAIICGRLGLGPAQAVDGLREIGLGLFEGLTGREAAARYPAAWAERGLDRINARPPGGESYADLALRVYPALDAALDWRARGTLVVAHRAVIQVLLARERGLGLEGCHEMPVETGSVALSSVSWATREPSRAPRGAGAGRCPRPPGSGT
jgi:probable phosphoglycerate mutase